MNYLIILFAILFFILSWRRLDWAVMFLITALPAYLIRFNILGLPSTLLEIMIWVVFIVWVIKNFSRVKNNFLENFKKNNQKIKIRYPFDWEIILLLLVALTAAAVSGFSHSSFGIWKAYFFEPVLFFIVVLNIMKGQRGRQKILWALAISAFLVSLLAIFQKFTGVLIDNPLWAAASTRRVVSFFGYPNAVGLYLGPIVLVLLGWLVSTVKNFLSAGRVIACSEKIKTAFMALVMVMSVFSIYFARSKGALLGVAAGLVVFGLLAGRKIRWAAIIMVLILGASVMAYQPTRDLTIKNITLTNLSGQIRKAGWSEAWKMLKDGRLITGAGLANYQAAVKPYHQEGIFVKNNDPDFQKKVVFNDEYRKKVWQPLEIYLYPHNIVLNFWSELGLAGLLLFIWIILKFFVIGIRGLFGHWPLGFGNLEMQKNKCIVIGLICAMVVIVIHGIVDVPYFKNDLAVMFWLLIAMMGVIDLEFKNFNKKNS